MQIFVAFDSKLIHFPRAASLNSVFVPVFFIVEELHQIMIPYCCVQQSHSVKRWSAKVMHIQLFLTYKSTFWYFISRRKKCWQLVQMSSLIVSLTNYFFRNIIHKYLSNRKTNYSISLRGITGSLNLMLDEIGDDGNLILTSSGGQCVSVRLHFCLTIGLLVTLSHYLLCLELLMLLWESPFSPHSAPLIPHSLHSRCVCSLLLVDRRYLYAAYAVRSSCGTARGTSVR